MTISDLNPIQFWPVAKQTFNEKIEPGIDRARYVYSPFLHDVQFLQVLNVDPVWMVSYDVDLNPLDILPFTETSGGSGIWNLQFTSTDIGSTCVYFKIGTVTNAITNPSFVATLVPWADAGGVNDVWVWDATNAAKVVFSASFSNPLVQTFAAKPAGIYSFSYTCKNTVALRSTTVLIQAYNGATLVGTISTIGETSTVAHLHSGQFIAASSFDRVKISVSDIFFAADYTFFLNDFSLSTFVPVFRSDLIYFTDDVFGTQLLQYSNANDYAGISYAAAEKFCLRVAAKFYEEREPEEDESEALSDSTVVKLSGTVKRQKLLEIEPLPPYLIFKLKLILKHNTLKVDDQYYIQEESLDVSKLNDRFALFLSKVWLTLRDGGYFTNVYGAPVSIDPTNNLPDPIERFTSDISYLGEVIEPGLETYFCKLEPAHDITVLGGFIDTGGDTYLGVPDAAHEELVFNDLINESGETYIGQHDTANPELVFNDPIEQGKETFIGQPQRAFPEILFEDGSMVSELTYLGDPDNFRLGWGCILDPCAFVDNSRILWDDGDRLQWDDGDNVDNG